MPLWLVQSVSLAPSRSSLSSCVVSGCGGGSGGGGPAGSHDASIDTLSSRDVGAIDSSTQEDSAALDAVPVDSMVTDTGSTPDSQGVEDSAEPDSSPSDTGAVDSESADSGFADTGDASVDGGTDGPRMVLDTGAASDVVTSDAPVSISVTVTGLATGDSVVLEDNGSSPVTVSANGVATVASGVVPGTSYDVTVKTQPSSPPQTCTVSGGAGTATSNVSDITVACATTAFSVGGTLTGLPSSGGSVTLQDNGGNSLTLTGNGSFTFTQPLASGSTYAVTVLTPPANQVCTVTGGSGTIATSNVTTVAVACMTPTYTIGGVVSGLASGATVALQDNGGDTLGVTSNGAFVFATPLQNGAAYAVTVSTQPSGQTCTVGGGAGTVTGSNITSVLVNCMAGTVTLGGTVSGLNPGSTLALRNGTGADTFVTNNGPFVLTTPAPTDAAYAVTIHGQPAGEACTVTNGTGTTGTTNVTNIAVSCVSLLSGTVTGLPSGEALVVSASGSLTTVFSESLASTPISLLNALASGAAYTVTVASAPTSPINVTCVVTANGTGITGTAAATSIAITCTPASCADQLLETPGAASGVYTLYPSGASASFQGYCDMTTAGGGWLLVGRSQPGGWTPGCNSTDGGNDFGWQTARGSLADDTQAYSLDVVTAGVTNFSALLFGSYTTGKTWGTRIFMQTLPANWFTTYQTTDVAFAARPTEVSTPMCVPLASSPDNGNPAVTGSMFLRGGYTAATYGFQLRDVPGGGFGLMASGWATCYGEDSYCYAGGINGSQGMMMVR